MFNWRIDSNSEVSNNLQVQNQMVLLESEAELHQRNEGAGGYYELNGVMRDGSLKIYKQRTVLDRINTKIEIALDDVSNGVQKILHLLSSVVSRKEIGSLLYDGKDLFFSDD